MARTCWMLLLTVAATLAVVATSSAAPATAGDEYFEKEVRPLLADRCFKCHGGAKTRGSLKLTSRDALLQGGDNGPAAVPGKPADSLLIKAVHWTDDTLKMPKDKRLSEKEVAVLTRWVEMGLPYPTAAATNAAGFHITDEQRQFWAFQPVQVVAAAGRQGRRLAVLRP